MIRSRTNLAVEFALLAVLSARVTFAGLFLSAIVLGRGVADVAGAVRSGDVQLHRIADVAGVAAATRRHRALERPEFDIAAVRVSDRAALDPPRAGAEVATNVSTR